MSKKEQIPVNLNDIVRVKLKDEGFWHMKALDDKTFEYLPNYRKPIEWYKGQTDDEGYIRLQMWDFMNRFGSTLGMGFQNIVETDIIIEKEILSHVR